MANPAFLPRQDNPGNAANDAAVPFREAPNNIEAEQALLGAILVNNEAYYRVSDFLEPTHFYDPLHRADLRDGGEVIRVGKTGHADHAQDVLQARRADRCRHDGAAVSRPPRRQATTIINAEDYGRTIYDLPCAGR